MWLSFQIRDVDVNGAVGEDWGGGVDVNGAVGEDWGGGVDVTGGG